MGTDTRLFFLLSRAGHALTRFVDRELDSRLGVSSTRLAALMHVAGAEGCQLKDLAGALGLNASAVTSLAERLERDGLLVREACALDGRATALWLTEQGRAVVEEAQPLMGELDNRLGEDLSDAERDVLLGVLSGLVRQFSPEAELRPYRTFRPPARSPSRGGRRDSGVAED